MKKKLGVALKVVTAIVLMTPTVAIGYVQFIKGDSLIKETVEVVTFINSVPANTKVTEEQLKFIEKELEEIDGIAGIITDPSAIIGKQTKNVILRDATLVDDFFDLSSIVLLEGESVFKIPDAWLYSFPQTIRRMDVVYFYPVLVDKELGLSHKPTLEPITSSVVFYAKDSNNREVLDTSSINRFDGSSTVNNIEIKVKDEQIKLLNEYVLDGYSFILSYN